jgi:hypothetical protein
VPESGAFVRELTALTSDRPQMAIYDAEEKSPATL